MANQNPASWVQVLDWFRDQKYKPNPSISIQQAQDRLKEALGEYFKANAPDEIRKNPKSALYKKYTLKNKRKNQVPQLVDDMTDMWMDSVFTPYIVPRLKKWKEMNDDLFDNTVDYLFEKVGPVQTQSLIIEALEKREKKVDSGDVKEDDGLNLPELEDPKSSSYWKEFGNAALAAAGGGLVIAASGRTDLFSGIVKGVAGAYGLHKAAKKNMAAREKADGTPSRQSGFTPRTANANVSESVKKDPDAPASTQEPPKQGIWSSIKTAASGVFNKVKDTVTSKPNTSDFTPAEEKAEDAADKKKMLGLLEKIEKNTRGEKGPKEAGKGIIDKLLDFAKFLAPALGQLINIVGLAIGAMFGKKFAAPVLRLAERVMRFGKSAPGGVKGASGIPESFVEHGTDRAGKTGGKVPTTTSEPVVRRPGNMSPAELEDYKKARAEGHSPEKAKEIARANEIERNKPNAKGSGINGPERAKEAIDAKNAPKTTPPKPTTVPEHAPNTSAPKIKGKMPKMSGAKIGGILSGVLALADVALTETNDDLTREEKNVEHSSSAGSVAGAVIGGALGSVLGPLGTIGGSMVGGYLGEKLGRSIGEKIFTPSTDNNDNIKPNSESGSAQQAYQFFIGKGWSAPQAAGIVGNLQAESSLKTDAKGDGGKAYGLAQWHPDRQAEFKSVFKKDIRESSFKEQLEFVQHELTHKEIAAGNKLKQATTPEDATKIVQNFYERAAAGPSAHTDKRISYAVALSKTDVKNTDVANSYTAPKVDVANSATNVANSVTNSTNQSAVNTTNTSSPTVNNGGTTMSSEQMLAMTSGYSVNSTNTSSAVANTVNNRAAGLQSTAPAVEYTKPNAAPTIINAPTTNNQNVTQSGDTASPRTNDNSYNRLLDRKLALA